MGLMEVFKSRWNDLQTREQQILRFSAVLLGLLLVYLFVVEPVYSDRNDAQQRLRSAQDALSVAQRQALDLKAAVSNPGTSASGPLLTEVESSAQQQGLRDALRRLQPSGEDQIQVSLEGASYDRLMKWLAALNQQGVRARRVDIQRDRSSDLLHVQLLLGR